MGSHLIFKNTRRSGPRRPSYRRHHNLKNSSGSLAPLVLFSAVREPL